MEESDWLEHNHEPYSNQQKPLTTWKIAFNLDEDMF